MISSNEMIRIRRQMQRRIRDVVAERRWARLDRLGGEPIEPATGEAGAVTASKASLVGSG